MDNNQDRSEIRKWIFQAIDGSIATSDFQRLQDAIVRDAAVRSEYLQAVELSESLCELAEESSQRPPVVAVQTAQAVRWDKPLASHGTGPLLALAAAIVFMVGAASFWVGRANPRTRDLPVAVVPAPTGSDDLPVEATTSQESLIAGHATLRRSVDVRWPDDAVAFRDGDVLPDGLLTLEAGLAEIDFFCGATLIVEGPAALDLESDWSVRVIEGTLRASVPPAARGFVIRAADSEIVDLGTEFAMSVADDNAQVAVIDGEVEIRGGLHDGVHLLTGQQQWLRESDAQPPSFDGLSTINDLERRSEIAQRERFEAWRQMSAQRSADPRLIAYYPITQSVDDRAVVNAAATGAALDARMVGPVEQTEGRFGDQSKGLQFDRPGARARVRIDGEFSAFTFSSWVRIDALDQKYNALFMGDGYENGEPHWQIRDDGRMMFSVMVDDSQDVRHFNRTDQKIVKDAGLHRVYFTPPFWDSSKAGQWFHLAAVYDPAKRRVVQYINGQSVSDEPIVDKFRIETLRIGPAEIGNWGQPFRKTPWFAVRNLNGSIDELAIYDAALSAAEIHELYEIGKPLGY